MEFHQDAMGHANLPEAGFDQNVYILGDIHPQLQYVSLRDPRFSSRMWSMPGQQTPQLLREAGFYCTGFGYCVICTQCEYQLQNFMEFPDLWREHSRQFPGCPFVIDKLQSSLLEAAASDNVSAVPRHPEYVSRESRLNSYTLCWPPAMPQRPQELTKAGFYYSGKSDNVVCYQCGGGLCDWEESQDPWERHVISFPSCPLVQARQN